MTRRSIAHSWIQAWMREVSLFAPTGKWTQESCEHGLEGSVASVRTRRLVNCSTLQIDCINQVCSSLWRKYWRYILSCAVSLGLVVMMSRLLQGMREQNWRNLMEDRRNKVRALIDCTQGGNEDEPYTLDTAHVDNRPATTAPGNKRVPLSCCARRSACCRHSWLNRTHWWERRGQDGALFL